MQSYQDHLKASYERVLAQPIIPYGERLSPKAAQFIGVRTGGVPTVPAPERFTPYAVAMFSTNDGSLELVIDRQSLEQMLTLSAYQMGALSYERGFFGRVTTWILDAIIRRRIIHPHAPLPRLWRLLKPVKG